uniref:WH2 domain-containing protein n=2 Tax=Caenorhabditis tropicalis TaxID=1561998 RepID=A0A1I7UJK0_9PELO
MLYMFPMNPQLHPSAMYPNQQFMRGKVRDLPDSGVIYLNRIKPIGQEFVQGTVAEVPVKKTKAPSSFERYNSEEERSPTRIPFSPSPTTTTSATTRAPPLFFAETKIDDQKLPYQKQSKPLSVPEEAELDRLLDDLLKNDNIPKQTLAKIKRSGTKRHVGGVAPRVISFDGTARVEKPRVKAYGSPVSVRLQTRKLLTSSTRNQGPDFDPWERMGQL